MLDASFARVNTPGVVSKFCHSRGTAEGRTELGRCEFVLVLTLASAVGDASEAQEIEFRKYANTPVGTNSLAAGYSFAAGNALLDPAVPINDLDADLHVVLLQYARSLGLLGRNAKLKVAQPYGFADWTGSLEGMPASRAQNGFGDTRVTVEWNFLGAPALSAADFASYAQDTVVGASFTTVLPTGSYDEDELLNLGSNRFAFRGELGVSHAIGPWILEGAATVGGFTDNDDFLESRRLSQDPLYAVRTHLIYNFGRPGLWAGLGAAYGFGGRTAVDGVARETRQRNWRFAAVLSVPLGRHQGVSLSIGTGIREEAGSDADVVAISYQFVWGG